MKNGGRRRNGRCQARLTLGSGIHGGDDVDAEPPAASTSRDTAAAATRTRRRWSRGAGQRRLAVARRRLWGRGGAEEEAHLGAAKDGNGRSRAAALAPGVGADSRGGGALEQNGSDRDSRWWRRLQRQATVARRGRRAPRVEDDGSAPTTEGFGEGYTEALLDAVEAARRHRLRW
ncbi:hypothetical protein E2562_031303 [Oryza meyeriana var. granulata]|uniref:Uncharacterized protein n=1 Tax=Oryza meyeriana var. granulata TaxID=110450 RepID=A0A6G1C9X9_9ORYZ|nr:hypothetical protein E2562_031303 [Oryza meyeriana var. granulata]